MHVYFVVSPMRAHHCELGRRTEPVEAKLVRNSSPKPSQINPKIDPKSLQEASGDSQAIPGPQERPQATLERFGSNFGTIL